MSQAKLKVGSDIVYYCNRCALDLGHTILAMVGGEPARVRCNTCRSERNYRQKARLSKVLDSSDSPSRGVSRPKVSAPEEYRVMLHANADKTPVTYRIDIAFQEKDVLDHPKFGRGVVMKLIHPDRMDVLFQDEARTLMRKAD